MEEETEILITADFKIRREVSKEIFYMTGFYKRISIYDYVRKIELKEISNCFNLLLHRNIKVY